MYMCTIKIEKHFTMENVVGIKEVETSCLSRKALLTRTCPLCGGRVSFSTWMEGKGIKVYKGQCLNCGTIYWYDAHRAWLSELHIYCK